MVDRPDKSFFDQDQNSGAFRSGMYEPMLDFMGQLPGGDPEESLALVTGVITPAKASVAVDTEGAAESDTLTNMGTGNLPVGSIVILRQADPGRQVTIKHNGAGAGAFLLDGGVDYSFPDDQTFLGFRHEAAGDWRQIFPQSQRGVDAVKNGLINGGFVVAQRGTSFVPSGVEYTLDCWRYAAALDGGALANNAVDRQAFALGQSDVAGNPDYYARIGGQITGGGGAESVRFEQPKARVGSYAGDQITISFDARGATARDLGVDIYQNFGSGGAPSATVWTKGGAFSLGTDWARYKITMAVPSVSGKTKGSDENDYLAVTFVLQAAAGSPYTVITASASTVDIANVMIERGERATGFEQRGLESEENAARVFYQTYRGGMMGFAETATEATFTWTLWPRMRAIPTIELMSTAITYRTDTVLNQITVGSTLSGTYSLQKDNACQRITGFSGLTNGEPVVIRNMSAPVFGLSAEL